MASENSNGLLLYLNINGTVTGFVRYGNSIWMTTSSKTLIPDTYNSVCFSWSPAGGVHLMINGTCVGVNQNPEQTLGSTDVSNNQLSNRAVFIIGDGTYSQFQRQFPMVKRLRQFYGKTQQYVFVMADLRIWNYKFYASELFGPKPKTSIFSRSNVKARNQLKIDDPLETIDIEIVEIQNVSWWPGATLALVCIFGLLARYDLAYTMKILKSKI